jgi:transcriptional regulator with XRE-family HTH domain
LGQKTMKLFCCIDASQDISSQKMARRKQAGYAAAMQSFGEWLRKMRDDKGVPLRTVAAATEMDQAHLSKVELGHRVPTEKQATALARYFGVESHDMEARRIAEKFRQDFADNPAAEMAVQMLNDRPPTGSTLKRNKQEHKTWC